MARVQLDPTTQSFSFDTDGAQAFVLGEDQFNTPARSAGVSTVAGGGLLPVKRVLAVQAAGPNIATTAGASSADIAVTGAQLGDLVFVQINGTTANPTVSLKGFVKSAGVVTVTGTISAAGAVDLSGSATALSVVVIGLT